jgi:hypothetical protein
MKKDILTRPFAPEQIKQRQGQHGKMLNYIETRAVIARLNEGCDAWAFEIVKHEIVEDEVIVVGKLVADGIIKMAFGGASITRDREGHIVDLGDTHKSAASDALKKAASLLGVGLELYGAAPSASAVAYEKKNAPAMTAAVGERITTKQLAAIQSVTRKQDIGRDDLVAMLGERFNKGELHALTKREASSLLSELIGSNGTGAHA